MTSEVTARRRARHGKSLAILDVGVTRGRTIRGDSGARDGKGMKPGSKLTCKIKWCVVCVLSALFISIMHYVSVSCYVCGHCVEKG